MTLYEILLILYLIVAIMLVAVVLLQQGKGAEMGASFGAGGSNTVFGAPGSGNFMTRATAILATAFFVISLTIGSITANRDKQGSDFENLESPAAQIPDIPIESNLPATELSSSDVPIFSTSNETDESTTEEPADVPQQDEPQN